MEIDSLLKEANETYLKNFKPETWFGRCIFLSWYCDVGTCNFCFRSTTKHKIKHAKTARRTISSILAEVIIAKNLGWRIEFLTGGYRIFPFDEIVKIANLVYKTYGEKIWINLGALKKEELQKLKPSTIGIVSSIEVLNPSLHNQICPDKPIEPYLEMFSNALGFKKSIALVIGLGEKEEDFELLKRFIKKNKLDRITFYALKPINGTPYKKGPTTEEYLRWIARTRIAFPTLEIIAGTTPRRVGEISLLLRAGANAITKFPATKEFNSEKARLFEQQVIQAGRKLKGSLTTLPKIDWDLEVEKLDLDQRLKEEIKTKLSQYLYKMKRQR